MDRKNKVMEIEIRTTLGHRFYVGLAGCQNFSAGFEKSFLHSGDVKKKLKNIF